MGVSLGGGCQPKGGGGGGPQRQRHVHDSIRPSQLVALGLVTMLLLCCLLSLPENKILFAVAMRSKSQYNHPHLFQSKNSNTWTRFFMVAV